MKKRACKKEESMEEGTQRPCKMRLALFTGLVTQGPQARGTSVVTAPPSGFEHGTEVADMEMPRKKPGGKEKRIKDRTGMGHPGVARGTEAASNSQTPDTSWQWHPTTGLD